MWYFTWILGLGAALAFGIINVMWLEASYTFGELDESQIRERSASTAAAAPTSTREAAASRDPRREFPVTGPRSAASSGRARPKGRSAPSRGP